MKLNWPNPTSLLNLSDHQRGEVAKAFASHVGILTGLPGCGKTHCVGEILKRLAKTQGTFDVGVAAPTGKAAQRVNQFLQLLKLPVEATTIHRMLGVQRNGHDQKGWGFKHNRNNPLRLKYVFVDEFSMVDTDLAFALFDAIEPGTHVLMIGDTGQLPPIGHGAPLRDLIAAGVPAGTLAEIRRQSNGLIVQACKAIREGREFRGANRIALHDGIDLLQLESHKPALTMQILKNLVGTLPPELDPQWDVQVLCAVNSKSDLSRKALNLELQNLLNPNGRTVANCKFRVGDKVICTQNSLLPLLEEKGEPVPDGTEDFVANGEIGRVADIDESGKFMIVEFPEPSRKIKVPLGKAKKRGREGEGAATDHAYDEANDTGCVFDLGNAITFHRSQGSQWPVVILIVDDYSGAAMVASRELVYTGISRAERICIVLGRKQTVDRWCKKVALTGRKTFLRELFAEKLQGGAA